jgi:hypothetical protein
MRSSEQMEAAADLAERYSFGEIRVSHEQNLILADVPQRELYTVWHRAKAAGLASPTVGLIQDLIACPGGDFCALANARSLPIAAAIQERFEDLDYQHDIGELELNISGCMNSCGHHHLGAIGILGVDKNGEEWYQVTLGGRQGNDARIGEVIGRAFAAADVPDAVERLIGCLSGPPPRRRALHRHLRPHRHRSLSIRCYTQTQSTPINQGESQMANKQIIKERRLQDDAWKVVNLVDGEAPFDVCLPVGPLLVPVSVWKAKKACLIPANTNTARRWASGSHRRTTLPRSPPTSTTSP